MRTISIIFAVFFFSVALVEAQPLAPNLLNCRSLERTTFQQHGPLKPFFDLQTDCAMPYGLQAQELDAINSYKNAGYIPHLMSGVSWGNYEDFLDGDFDGINHWDQGQVDANGVPIMHGPRVPYLIPSIAFSRYLEVGFKKAVDAGVLAIFPEEPEIWARSGYSEAFKREWLLYYKEPWVDPQSSCDAQYRAGKLRHYLYARTFSELCNAVKEYSLLKYNRIVRFFVPTHSLVNYSHWSIVSPEAAMLDIQGIDGLICQTWTGTSRTHNYYNGVVAERTFESGYLEYNSMQELTSGTGKRLYLLHDPIEDNPQFDWEDYRKNYICTLIASLLQTDTHYYEVCPWPSRVFHGKYPQGSSDAISIPREYATILLTCFNQLRDMDQSEISWNGATDGIGVLMSDSAMFQRAEPYLRDGAKQEDNDQSWASRDEVMKFAPFYGLTLPLVKFGVPVRVPHLENLSRYPGYLDKYQILILSYEFQKPQHPSAHAILAEWVKNGGVLIYVGADTDPFLTASDWWNRDAVTEGSGQIRGSKYSIPTEHLFDTLGLPYRPQEGKYDVGNGQVVVVRKHPASFTRSLENANGYRKIISDALNRSGRDLSLRNHFLLRRGPYLITAVMEESVNDEPLIISGRFIDLLDANLAILSRIEQKSGTQGWYIDLDRMTAVAPSPLAASGRVTDWSCGDSSVCFILQTPAQIDPVIRVLLAEKPVSINVNQAPLPIDSWLWDAETNTLLIRFPTQPIETNPPINCEIIL